MASSLITRLYRTAVGWLTKEDYEKDYPFGGSRTCYTPQFHADLEVYVAERLTAESEADVQTDVRVEQLLDTLHEMQAADTDDHTVKLPSAP